MIYVNKMNKNNKNRFIASTNSRSSFGSMLESIRETDGTLQDDQQTRQIHQINQFNQFNLQSKKQLRNPLNKGPFMNKFFATDKGYETSSSESQKKNDKFYLQTNTDERQSSSQNSQNSQTSSINIDNYDSEIDLSDKESISSSEVIQQRLQGENQKENYNQQKRQNSKKSQKSLSNLNQQQNLYSSIGSSFVQVRNSIQRNENSQSNKDKFRKSLVQTYFNQKDQQQFDKPSHQPILNSIKNNNQNSNLTHSIQSFTSLPHSSHPTKSIPTLPPRTIIRPQPIRQFTISLIQYCSHQIGLACYNNTTGQIFLCQLVQNMTYFKTISTIETFYPKEIIYPNSLQQTLLIKKLNQCFGKNTVIKSFMRKNFDDIDGEILYQETTQHQDFNTSNKFLAFACFNALVKYLEGSLDTSFKLKSVKINWHKLNQLLIIQPDAVADLQIFYNYDTKKSQMCLLDCFNCLTFGGKRLLRANLLQPSSSESIIVQRQNLVQRLLQNPSLVSSIQKQLYKYRHYQPITAKFIHNPRQKNLKSLKSFISAIFILSNQCMSLSRLHRTFQDNNALSLPIFDKLDIKLQNPKVSILRKIIIDNFQQNILKNFQQIKNKKDKFIFLFKAQKIQNQFVNTTRNNYLMTIDQIKQTFNYIKRNSNEDIQMLYNEYRGYFLRTKDSANLQQLAQCIGQNLVQISVKGKSLTFSTQILASLNNRLQQYQKILIFQCQTLLIKIISQIQQNIDILFQINSLFSTIDMIISFVKFIEKHSQEVKFIKPIIKKQKNSIRLQNLLPVWLKKDQKQLKRISLEIKPQQQQHIIISQKSQNSAQQHNFMFSIGYCVILTQIGCFIPAQYIQMCLFQTLLTKIQIKQHTQFGLSRFQLTLLKIQNILNNCIMEQNDQNNGNCLIIMDEIIKGTQHQEQCALSLAVVEEILKNNGISIISTSDRVFIKYLKQFDQFQNQVNFIKTQQFQKEQQAVEKMTQDAIKSMQYFNFDKKFIQSFKEIETVYRKIN